MQPGPELDELVGRLLGVEPRLIWGVGKRAENSWTYTADEWQCRDWLARHQEEFPEHAADMEVYPTESWPRFSTDGNAMLVAIYAMRERGLHLGLGAWPERFPYRAYFHKQHKFGESDSLPHAVALAVVAALEGLPERERSA